MSIRLQISAGFLAVGLLVAAVVVAALWAQLEVAERASVLEARNVARTIAIGTGESAIFDPRLIQRHISSLHRREERDIFVVDLDKRIVADVESSEIGAIFAGDTNDAIGKTLADGQVRTFDEIHGIPRRVAKQVVTPLRKDPSDRQSPIVGALIVEYTPIYEALRAEAWTTTRNLAVVCVAIVFLAAILGNRIASGIASPIAELERGAAALAAGNYDSRVKVQSNDEIGGLAAAFNRMAEDLSVSHAELVEHRRELEERVVQGTAEWQRAKDQLLQAEKMASIGQLASGVAHEINNPVGYVYSNLSTLDRYLANIFELLDAYRVAEGSIADEGMRNDLESAKRTADIEFIRADVLALLSESREGLTRVTKIVQDLKNFSRSAGDENWQRADLHQGIDTTLNIVWNDVKYKADVHKQYGELPQVQCRPSQLNQVFMNMLLNAAQAIQGRGTISIRTGVEGDDAWVEIADTGNGIKPEHLSRIFDPFFTTKAVGEGTGLGLSVSYGIVKEHGGRIDVQSEVGRGTVFRVWIPIVQPGSAGPVASSASTRNGAPAVTEPPVLSIA